MEKVTKKRKLAPRKTVMSSGLKPLTLTGLSDRTKKDLGILGAEGDELVIEDPTTLGGKGFNLESPKQASRAKKRKSTMPPEKPSRKSPRIATIDKLDIASDEGSSNGAETGVLKELIHQLSKQPMPEQPTPRSSNQPVHEDLLQQSSRQEQQEDQRHQTLKYLVIKNPASLPRRHPKRMMEPKACRHSSKGVQWIAKNSMSLMIAQGKHTY